VKIISVVGARPNFMKIAPIIKAVKKKKNLTNILVHTGQHYDKKMSKLFFDELDIPKPDINMEVGSDTHAQQTAKIMMGFEKILIDHKPDLVLVVGDVNSTMACAITAAKLNIPVGHIEAGLRSFDRTMPEEINRLVTDSISDFLFTTSIDADQNLKKEGVPAKKIFLVGNVMIDTLLANTRQAKNSRIMNRLGLKERDFALVTLHRPSNVDEKNDLKNIIEIFLQLQKHTKVVFPIHPRTHRKMEEFGLLKKTKDFPRLIFTEPLGYLDFLNLMMHCRMVFTDSGGIQEETSVLRIPCLTLRENTERPITVTYGTNVLVGLDKKRILREAERILRGQGKKGREIPLWDGQAARRIADILSELKLK